MNHSQQIKFTEHRTLLSLGASLLLPFIVGIAPAIAGDPCTATANRLRNSCHDSAESDYRRALAICQNVSNVETRQACRDQAAHALSDAKETCRDQSDARLAACQKLGQDRYDPVINPTEFIQAVNNPYFPLRPGTTLVYEGQTADGLEHSEFAVTHRTREILGVTCIEVHDSVTVDGELTEDTLDWFAQDTQGNVWYFGENTHELEDGLITTIEGTFMAGVDGAKPGIIMKAHPVIGDFYRQEFSLAEAEDFAETVALNEAVTVPAGTFMNCLKSQETTPLEIDLLEFKFYAPNVGNVLTVDGHTGDRIELIEIRMNSE